ncbi:hypothetical protein BDV95DRAFT_604294 [Massariosphaeria phaeospora]|uniref:Cytochrome b5 heme-binding domain-containing protein n=1 Tax=Massariosphaeria phaeospora TaxID=100035 RepID=A0A7C8I9S1_9PLEO|nr:hypothetical protein BDV95DRAFT_604294 [Massariosphaeria phaeospora]
MAARYRKNAANSSSSTESSPEPAKPIKDVASEPGIGLSVLDVLRVLGGILLLSSGISYLSTNGESMTWGYNPWWTRAREWKAFYNGEVSLTDAELLAYDGSDGSKPIYLALNGTIYDVSANRATYGPGGSYHFFAGHDAARAFLTGCFEEDRTPDLRGVELMYMPVDGPPSSSSSPSNTAAPAAEQPQSYDPATGKETSVPNAASGNAKPRTPLTKAQLKNRRAQELRQARKQAVEGLEHWHQLFRGDKGKPYFRVGEVRRERGWLEGVPERKLCEHAEKGRPKREE